MINYAAPTLLGFDKTGELQVTQDTTTKCEWHCGNFSKRLQENLSINQ